MGSGGIDRSKENTAEGASNFAGSSLNGTRGAEYLYGNYETAGGGTGHPFGKSGKTN